MPEQKSLELHPPDCKIEKINKKKGLRWVTRGILAHLVPKAS